MTREIKMPFEKRKAEVGQRKTFPGYVSNERAVVCKGDHFFCTQPFSPEQLMQKIWGNGCRTYLLALFMYAKRFLGFLSIRTKLSRREEIVCSVNNFGT